MRVFVWVRIGYDDRSGEAGFLGRKNSMRATHPWEHAASLTLSVCASARAASLLGRASQHLRGAKKQAQDP